MTAVLAVLLASSVGISWQKSLDTALSDAQKSDKPVLVDFWAEWCTWCHELDRTTYVDPAVVAAAHDFVAVKVNTEGSRSEVKATEHYGVESLPTIGFLTPTGRLFYRVDGFQHPDRFVETLKTVHEIAPDVISWDATIARTPNDPAALAKLGAHFFDVEIFEESRDLLQHAAAHDRGRPAAERKKTRVLLGIIETFEKKYGEADKLLKEALAVTPADPTEDAAALFALGRTYMKWKKPEQARAFLKKALDTDPGGPMTEPAKTALGELDAK
jgi:thiol-disulfide isomerase/thioredoxin